MNEFVTIYELLGLIKDGKAPKKIEYQGNILEFDGKDYKFYKNADVLSEDSLVKYIAVGNLKDKVEILKEDKPIIEKIDLFDDLQDILNNSDESIVLNAIHKCLTTEKYKLNEVIDYINRKENNDKH